LYLPGRVYCAKVEKSAHHLSKSLVEQFLCLVDLCGQIRASASIGVVQEHELSMVLAHFVLGQCSLPGSLLLVYGCEISCSEGTYDSSKIKEASRRVILGSKPL
jgi:hypothetical protein